MDEVANMNNVILSMCRRLRRIRSPKKPEKVSQGAGTWLRLNFAECSSRASLMPVTRPVEIQVPRTPPLHRAGTQLGALAPRRLQKPAFFVHWTSTGRPLDVHWTTRSRFRAI
jgi:hypothetical protein